MGGSFRSKITSASNGSLYFSRVFVWFLFVFRIDTSTAAIHGGILSHSRIVRSRFLVVTVIPVSRQMRRYPVSKLQPSPRTSTQVTFFFSYRTSACIKSQTSSREDCRTSAVNVIKYSSQCQMGVLGGDHGRDR